MSLVDDLAALLHDEWRATRRRADGSIEPRWKETTDMVWLLRGGARGVDIANTAYPDLPSDWQAENRAAAEYALTVAVGLNAGALDDPKIRAVVGQRVHLAWQSRNARWDNLDPETQEKDIAQVRLAQALLGVRP